MDQDLSSMDSINDVVHGRLLLVEPMLPGDRRFLEKPPVIVGLGAGASMRNVGEGRQSRPRETAALRSCRMSTGGGSQFVATRMYCCGGCQNNGQGRPASTQCRPWEALSLRRIPVNRLRAARAARKPKCLSEQAKASMQSWLGMLWCVADVMHAHSAAQRLAPLADVCKCRKGTLGCMKSGL
jgi:hypothetical protein